MQFAHPNWLLLLLPSAFATWRVLRHRKRNVIPYAGTNAIRQTKKTWRMLLYHLTPWLYPIIMTLLIITLARPRKNLSSFQRESNAISIMMVVDVSGSMEALDLSNREGKEIVYRTRLDVVKQVFADFIESRPDDLIGLVSFGGYASVLAPLTLDHDALFQILEGLEVPSPLQDPSSGAVVNEEERMTAVGDALGLATARIRETETESRVIVLLSDGDSNAGILDPMQAADIAKKLNIRVYTIGVGTTGYAPVRVTDASGRQSIQHAHITIDEKTLQNIATLTGGEYFNTLDEEGLNRALVAIGELETTPVRRQILERYDEKYRGVLLSALLLFVFVIVCNATYKPEIL
jgi:Ca-activated chloride channel family protein